LTTLYGNDTTQVLLNSNQHYVMIFAKDFSTIDKWKNGNLSLLMDAAKKNNVPLFLVTADIATAQQQFSGLTILSCDATVIKTAARTNPTFLFMQGAFIKQKLSYAKESELVKTIQSIKN
jgi:hypothetical protein